MHESIHGLKKNLGILFLYLFCPLKEGNSCLSIMVLDIGKLYFLFPKHLSIMVFTQVQFLWESLLFHYQICALPALHGFSLPTQDEPRYSSTDIPFFVCLNCAMLDAKFVVYND